MGSGCFLRMQKAWSGLSGSVPSFFLFLSKTFPLWQPEQHVLGATAGAAGSEPSWRLDGCCSPRMPAGWAARGSSPHPRLFSSLGWSRDGGCTGMTGCGRSGGKKPLGEGLQLALLEVWSASASLRWETQRGKAGQICSGESGL